MKITNTGVKKVVEANIYMTESVITIHLDIPSIKRPEPKEILVSGHAVRLFFEDFPKKGVPAQILIEAETEKEKSLMSNAIHSWVVGRWDGYLVISPFPSISKLMEEPVQEFNFG